MDAPMKKIRVLELYSGIGGMHCALAGSGLPYEVVMAADVNTMANIVYTNNFQNTLVNSSAIESLTVKDFEELKVDMILMSPPCQPFTRVGKQKDTSDIRTKSFLHVLNVLKKMESRPDYILVENVKGFESSESRKRLVDTLQTCHYNYQELLLTPLQFGIPNSRLRYFLIAKKQPKSFIFIKTEQIMNTVPECATEWLSWKQKAGNHGNSSQNQECGCYGIHEGSLKKKDAENQRTGGSKRSIDTDKLAAVDSETARKRQKVDAAESKNDKETAKSTLDNYNVAEYENESVVKETAKSTMGQYGGDVNVTCDLPGGDVTCDLPGGDVTCGLPGGDVTCDLPGGDSDDKPECDNGSRETFDDKPHQENEHVQNSVDKVCQISTSSGCLQNYGVNLRLPVTDEQKSFGACVKLNSFLEDKFNCVELFEDYLIPEKDFKRLMVMDVVNGCTQKSCCFTKRYGHYIDGAGSLVLMTTDTQGIQKASELKLTASELKNRDQWGDAEFSIIRDLKLRYFTPREIANILCFPATYSFPDGFTNRQLYMLLGNSLNVHIVTVLIKIMTAGDLNNCE